MCTWGSCIEHVYMIHVHSCSQEDHGCMMVFWPVQQICYVLLCSEHVAVSSFSCSLQTKSAKEKKRLLNYKQSVEIGHYGGGML